MKPLSACSGKSLTSPISAIERRHGISFRYSEIISWKYALNQEQAKRWINTLPG
jgi:hypothetical protein